MNQPNRLLIIATSRYDCLIMRRELANRFPNTNITTMTTAKSGLYELNSNSYDSLILELNSLSYATEETVNSIEQIIVKRETMLTILLRSVTESRAQVAQVESLSNLIASERLQTIAMDASYEQQLPDFINRFYALAVDVVPASSTYLTSQDRSNWIDPTDMAGQLAHEINNPLMMITGTAELLLQNSPELSGEVGKRLKIIMRSAGRIKAALVRLKEQEQSRI